MSTLKTTNIQHPSAGSPAVELTAAGGLWLGGGKILQVVRATDTTERSTTSASFVDVTGMSVTITPQKDTSAIIVLAHGRISLDGATSLGGELALTDSSNNLLSGAEANSFYVRVLSSSPIAQIPMNLIAYTTPATTSAVTYKMRFRLTASGTVILQNNLNTGQLFAIEVSA
jgi:hypothetical protein